MRRRLLHGLTAGAVAAVLSGAPSTAHALVTRRPLLDAARAAGALLGRRSLARGVVAHLAISAGWALALTTALPKRGAPLTGAAAGVAIYLFDMEIVGRRWPEIRSLPKLPQLADHVAFGAVVGWVHAAAE